MQGFNMQLCNHEDATLLCRGRETVLPVVTQLVTYMMDKSFDWEASFGNTLPNLQALTLLAKGLHSDPMTGVAFPIPPGAGHIEDLRVQLPPGDILQPYHLVV